MSWHYLQGGAAESSAECSSDGELLARLKLSLAQEESCCADRQTALCHSSRYGMMSEHSALIIPPAQSSSTSCGPSPTDWLLVADFHAKTLALPERVRVYQENEADSGLSTRASFAKFDPDTCSWKTPHSLFPEASEQFYADWPQWGILLNGECFAAPTLEPRTKERGYSLLPTPTRSNAKRGCGISGNLDNLRMSLGSVLLAQKITKIVGWKWPAPFLEWMMGWPVGWTGLKPLEMDNLQLWRQQHLEC